MYIEKSQWQYIIKVIDLSLSKLESTSNNQIQAAEMSCELKKEVIRDLQQLSGELKIRIKE